MKKQVYMLLCLIAMITVLVGCGGGSNTPTGNGETTGTKEKITVTIGLPESSYVTDYENNEYTLWLEEYTGYEIEIIKYNSAQYDTQLATDVAGFAKLPDILYGFRLNSETIDNYGEEGVFIDLTPYFEDKEKSQEFWDGMEGLTEFEQNQLWIRLHSENRTAVDGEQALDGPIYAYPTVEVVSVDSMDFMPMINQKWLDNMHLQAPTNLTELKNVLIAFKNGDPNGNGDTTDEVPLLGCTGALGHSIVDWLINFFVYQNDQYHFNMDANGKLYLPYTTDAYRDALKYINELVDEGLMNPLSLTYNMKQLRTVLMNTDTVGVTVGHPTVQFLDSEAILNWVPLDLYGNVYFNENMYYRDCFITDSCVNPEAAWDVIMALSSQEGYLRRHYGVLGRDWEWVDAEKTTMRRINDITAQIGTVSWQYNACGIYNYPILERAEDASAALKYRDQLESQLLENYNKALEKVDKSQVCAWLLFSEEESEMAPKGTDIIYEVNRWQALFIDGTKDITNDTVWNEYLKVLNDLGLKDYEYAAQHCYDRMYK